MSNKKYFSKSFSTPICLAALLLSFLTILSAAPVSAVATQSDPRLGKAYRFQRGGWTYVHLEGSA